MTDKLDIIIDIVKEINKKQDSQSERLIKLECEVERNSEDLTDHIEGVKQTRKLIAQNDRKYQERFDKLEEPRNTAKSVGKFLKWFFSIIAVVGMATLYLLKIYNIL
jgi:hypothetical protein